MNNNNESNIHPLNSYFNNPHSQSQSPRLIITSHVKF